MTIICRPIGKPLTTIVFRIAKSAPEVAQLAAAQPQRQVLDVDVDEEAEQRGVIGDQRRHRRAGDAQLAAPGRARG